VETLEQIKNRAELAARGAKIDIVVNPGPSQQIFAADRQRSRGRDRTITSGSSGLGIRLLLKCDRVDWPDRIVRNTKVKTVVEGVEKEIDQTTEEKIPGYLEAVYHLYSIKHNTGR